MKIRGNKKILLICIIAFGALLGATQKFTVCAEKYVYDELNRVIMVLYDDGGTVEYVYDSNGNMIQTIVDSGRDDNNKTQKWQQPDKQEQADGIVEESLAEHRSHLKLSQTQDIAAYIESVVRKATEYIKNSVYELKKLQYGEEKYE